MNISGANSVCVCEITWNMYTCLHSSYNNFVLISSFLPHTVRSISYHHSDFTDVETEAQRAHDVFLYNKHLRHEVKGQIESLGSE